MGNTSLIRTVLLLALLAAFGLAATGYAPAADRAPAPGRAIAPERTPPVVTVVGSEASSQFLPLGVGKSVVIDLPRDIKDVLVGDPQYANAVIRSSRRAYIIGVKTGQTSVYFFDARRPADRRLRHRDHTRSQRIACRHQAGAARSRHPRRGPGRGHPAQRQR